MKLGVKMTKADIVSLKEELARQMRMTCNVSVVEQGDDVIKVVTDFNDKTKVHLEFCTARPINFTNLTRVQNHFAPDHMYMEPGEGVTRIVLRSVSQDNLGIDFRMHLEIEK